MTTNPTRRRFLADTASAAASAIIIPYWWSSQTASAQQPSSANDRIRWGALGTGDRWASMGDNTQLNGVGGHAAKFGDFLAVCDVDATHCERARTLAGGKSDCYEDYRHVLERNDIDAVTIVTPDHWHTPMAVAAMRAGKDVYCEKPLTLTVDEGKLICKVVQETGRVFQVGTQQRSEFDLMFLQAVAIAHAGRVGAIRRVTVAIGAGPASGPLPVVDPPKGLNWDFWLGPAPYADYRYKEADPSHGAYSRCHFEFRWWYDYSGGKLTDWGAHHVDIAQWAMKLDQTGPVRVEPLQSKFPVPFKDGYPTLDDQYNTPIEFHVKCTYANGAELIIRHNASDLGFDNGILIEGTEGRFFVNRERLTGKPVEQLAEMPLPEGTLSQLYKGKKPGNHMGNFVECLRTREQPISDVFSHHRAMTTCHLANIALRLNRPIQWNPDAEKIEGDEQAATFLYRTPRNGYPMPT